MRKISVGMKLHAAVALGLFSVLAIAQTASAQFAAAGDPPLKFGDNFFVTGDYAIGGAVFGKSNNGFVTGTISIGGDTNPGVAGTNTVPQGAQIVAALLYWQTIEIVGGATGQNGFFRPVFNGGPQTGYPIEGTILKNPNGIVYWDGTGCASSTTPKQLVTYRAEVRAFLRQDPQGNVIANGQYEVMMPSQSNGTPLTMGATLVIIYRVLSPNVPFNLMNSIVIYDGTPASASTTTQNIQGFYDAAHNPVSKLTYIVGNGRKNLSETVSLNNTPLPSLYGGTSPPFPGFYVLPTGAATWDNPTWFFAPTSAITLAPNPINPNPLPEDASSATTSVVTAHQGCVTPAAIIYSTTVKNTDGDGLLDSWKANHGYCDASFNEAGTMVTQKSCTDAGSQWVDLTGAVLGTQLHPHPDVFMQLNYMCYKLLGSEPASDSCDTTTSFTNSLNTASAASGGTTTYTGTGPFSPPFQLNQFVSISGFTDPHNNGNFIVVGCVSNPVIVNNAASCTGNQLVVNNANGVTEANAPGIATFTDYSFDPRKVFDSITDPTLQTNSFAEVNAAYLSKGITLHPEWHAMQETPGCTDTVVNGVPSYCPYLNQPGLVGWKGGFDLLKGQPLNYPEELSCEQAPPLPSPNACVRRFQHGRKDSYHEMIFGHAQGGPEWSFQAGTLTSVVASGQTVTFTTSTPHGLVAASGLNDQNPLARVTVSDAITNTMLNGTYLVQNPTTFSFTISTLTNAPCPTSGCTPFTDPRLSVASGRIHTRSGFSDVGGGDSMVTLGRWDPVLAQQATGTTFMHEVGHANGLSHGGYYYDGLKVDQNGVSNNNYIPTVEANCKSNFQSVMNYPFQLNHLDTGSHKVVDYSEEQLVALDEQGLPNAVTTINLTQPSYLITQWYTPSQPVVGGQLVGTPAKTFCDGTKLPTANPPVMYLVSGPDFPMISPAWSTIQDINFDGSTNLPTDTQMRGHSDWTNVVTNGGLVISPGMNLLQVGATGADAFGGGGSLGPGGGALGPGGGALGPGGGALGPGGGALGPGGGSLGPGGGALGPGGGALGPGGGALGPGGGVGEVDFATATAVTYPPSDLTATEGELPGLLPSPRTITLNWTAGFGLIGAYKIYRSDDGGANFSVIATVTGNPPATTFTDTVTCNPIFGHQYFVTAVQSGSSPNPGQESGPSNTVSTGQNKEPLTGCYTITAFSSPASAVQGSTVAITWTLQDTSNLSGTPVTRQAANTLVAIGPGTLLNGCTPGRTTLLADGNPTNAADMFSNSGDQFTFTWKNTDAFCAGSYTFELDLDHVPASPAPVPAQVQTTTTPLQLSIDINDTDSNPHITTLALTAGTVGLAYSNTLIQDGGTAPFQWTFSGSLPLGISQQSLNSNTLSGTTCAAGTYNFTAMVTDSRSISGTQPLTLQINKANTTTGVMSNASTSVFQQMVTFTVTVAPQYSCTPTGTVTLFDGVNAIANSALSGGMATFKTSALSVGIHQITASYGGDSNFNASNSPTLSQTVNKASTTTTISSVLPSPAVVGQAITVAYTLAVVSPGAGTPIGPSGTVTVAASDGSSCMAAAALGPGACVLSPAPTTAGSKTFTVTYSGDNNFVGSGANGNYTVNIYVSDTAPPPFTPTTTLPDATVGVPYTNTVFESGGVTTGTNNFSWTIVPNSVMPGGGSTLPGLSFQPNTAGVTNGTLSGTPTMAGTFTFTAMVTDSVGNTGTQMFTLRVATASGFAYVANCATVPCDDVTPGSVLAYSIVPTTGALTPVSGSPFPAGRGPFSVAVDPTGQFLYVANLGLGVSAYRIGRTTGALTQVAGSPFTAPGALWSVAVDPTGKFVYAAGGSSNNVSAYSIDRNTGALTPVAGSPFPAGANAFAVAVDPAGPFAYVINNAGKSVSAYRIDATTGALTQITGSPFAAGTSPIVIAIDPTGRFAYVANNGDNTVSAYTIDGTTGALNPVAGSPFATGVSPRSVTVDPTGNFVYTANQGGNVSAYSINGTTGALTPVAGSPFPAGAQPVWVAVDRSARFTYVTNLSSANVSAYAINGTTGALTAVAGSPFSAGTGPVSVTAAAPGFFDGTFNNSDWTLTKFDNSVGGTTSATQVSSGGNPGAYRQITNTVGNAPSAAPCLGNIVGFHAKTSAVYNLAQQGAITSIDYSEDAILISGSGDGQGAGPALIQGGQVYLGPQHVTPSFSWTHFTNLGLSALDFAAVNVTCNSLVDASKHPDFSSSGSTIQFGFFRANSTGPGGPGYTIVGGIDNWTVMVH